MFAKVVSVVVLALVACFGSFVVTGDTASADAPPPGPPKTLTLTPNSGVVGTVVVGELTNAPPNDFITAIFKIPGDPVLATGTSDANGHLVLTFTIPYVPGGGTYPVFFTDFKCSCQIATDFTVINSRPTPIPTATPTTPASATPTKSPTQPPATLTPTAAATATATPTPGVPVLGTGAPGSGPGPNVGVLGLGFLAIIVTLAWFAATRRGPSQHAFALAESEDFGPDYSTELNLATLDLLRRAPEPAARSAEARTRNHGAAWAIGAAGAALAGIALFRRKR